MSASERVVQSILYEVGCILIGCLVMLFVPHDGQPFVLMVIFSLLAMVWNFVFNWIFDKLVPGEYVPYRFHHVCYVCTSHMALWLEKWSRYCLDCTSSGTLTRHVAIATVYFDYGPWHDCLCICSALVTT